MSDANDLFDKHLDANALFEKHGGNEPIPENPDEYSTLGAGALGAVKSATFSFDDEIGGFTKALYDKGVKGKKDNFWDLYDKVRDSIRQEHAAAEEQHPVASFAGEMVGGLVPMALAPEALIGKGAATGASWLSKAKALGTTGAKVGALAGLGGSEADITKGQVGQAAADTLGGAASGAALGVAMEPVMTGVKTLGKGAWNIAKSYPIIGELADTAKQAAGGLDLLGAQNSTTANTEALASSINRKLENLRSTTGAARQAAIDAASDTGLKVGTEPWYHHWMEKSEAMISTAGDNEIQDIRHFQKNLKAVMQEVETPVTSHVSLETPQGQLPEEAALEKTKSTMTQRALADRERANLIENNLAEDIRSGKLDPNDEADAKRMEALLFKVKTLREGNEFNPQTKLEPGTQREGVVNLRGENKAPVVNDIKPAEFDANAAQIKSKIIEQGRTEATPTELSKFATSFGEQEGKYGARPGAEGRVGSTLFREAKQDLQKMIQNAAKLSPDAKQEAVDAFEHAIVNFQDETGNFINVAKTQETLGQPGFSAYGKGDNKVKQLQNMIQNYNKKGSNARLTIDNALDQLAVAYPEEASNIKRLIVETSKNRDIAMGLSAQSPLATNMLHASAKSILLQLGRIGGLAYGGILKHGGASAKNTSEALINTGNAIYGASPETVQGMVDRALAKGGAFGNMVAKTLGSIVDAPDAKRRAVLFTLMQQPDFRKFAQEHIAGEENP